TKGCGSQNTCSTDQWRDVVAVIATLSESSFQRYLTMTTVKHPATRSTPRTAFMRGFTLIEMIVVVAVIAIVASIAYPAYQDYIARTRRTEAKALLMELTSKLERCFVEYNAYNHKDCPLQNNA